MEDYYQLFAPCTPDMATSQERQSITTC